MSPSRLPVRLVLALVLIVLVAVALLLRPGRSPESAANPVAKSAPSKNADESPELSPLPPAGGPGGVPAPAGLVDPMHQQMADRLNSAETTPQQDLETLAEFIAIYGKAFGGNPIGGNEDITSAMTGYGGNAGRVFPPGHRTIRDGQVTDRWGTPYWFHPNSGSQMEIRSAGPDKNLFTPDDIVHNPSPAGLGITPVAPPSQP